MSRFKIVTADEVLDMLKGRKYKWAQVHHTYKPNHSNFTGDNHISLQTGMYRYHVYTRGWRDIGQHLSIFPDGLCVTGRDFDWTPAGIKGWNTGAFMIEHIGNFDKGHDKLEGAQLRTSLKIYHFLVNHCGAKILFHREHAVKSCPGTGINKAKFVQAVKNFDGAKTVDVHNPQTKGETIQMLLDNGDSGKAVKNLQNDLIQLGYKLPKYGADGQYGDETEQAVRRFQKDHGLAVDGIAGPKTLGKIESIKSGDATFTINGKTYKVVEV